MLTYLRKIRKSLIESGSTPKYLLYAVGEIALVVIGILIALQINNWNEWRKEREMEKEVLKDLSENIQRNSDLLIKSMDLLIKGSESSQIILDVIDKKLPYSDTLNQHFWFSKGRQTRQIYLSQEGYEALKNRGIDIIRSASLKNEILRLFEITYIEQKEMQSYLSGFYYAEADFIEKNFILEKYMKLRPINFNALINDSYYYSFLHTVMGQRNWVITEHTKCLKESTRVLQLIKEELCKE